MADLTEILNWREWDELVSLSGQPSETQLRDLSEAGVKHIINLGPHSNKGALEDEASSVKALGMAYIYIPVKFQSPKESDFDAFCAALEACAGERAHVHCIYNARVSAFFYRYAKEGRGGEEKTAFALMDSIWRPGQDWAQFIDREDAIGQLNRYAGEDY